MSEAQTKFISKAELKARFSEILRDPATPPGLWIQAYTKAEKLFRWKRRERTVLHDSDEPDVWELVKQIQASKRGNLQ